jgi:hypothetical protein
VPRSLAPIVSLLAALAAGEARGAPQTDAHTRPAPELAPTHTELGIIPLVGGDTDVGIGVGQLSTLAAVAPGVTPYLWALETAAFISFAPGRGSGMSVAIPYQDYFAQLTLPRLLGGRLRLQVRPSFTRETTQRYYGIGNASPAPADDVAARDFYGRTHPTLVARARYRLYPAVHVEAGASYTQNWLAIDPQSTLAADLRGGPLYVRGLLRGAQSHGVLFGEASVLYDTRDSELSPTRGQFHQVRLRLSPRIGDALPYDYQQLGVTTRGYVTLLPGRLVASGRIVFDLQTGHPPFYELARFDDTFALGGVNGVRGVPGQRYYGKVKLFSNWELRSQLTSFQLWGKPIELGATGFVDVGRLWADLGSRPQLDGAGLGLKYGLGSGLRVQEGQTFVVRGDVAWSPDARPIGVYVGAGQLF